MKFSPTQFRRAKKKADITFKALADEIGVSERSIYAWLEGSVVPKSEHLFRLAGALGVPADKLMVGG